MSLYDLIRPVAFLLDPEAVHERALYLLSRGVFQVESVQDPRLEQQLFGVHFPNPLGLAAGFDKNAVAVEQWDDLGFGFVEVGTVTFHPQPGNPKPRLFRVPKDRALINRLGFNNEGARTVAGRLASSRPSIPVGVNLGKSKITSLEDAPIDYQESFRLLLPFGDYFVVNVSSPNTPGLRSLQERGPLLEILGTLRGVHAQKPLFVKVAPDLELDALDDVIQVGSQVGVTGVIATNTTISRPTLASAEVAETGGLSGAPVREMSNRILQHLHQNAPRDWVLIGVGGVANGRDLFEKIALGAHLVQVYTGWVYGGPSMVPRSLRELLGLMDRFGIANLSALRGQAELVAELAMVLPARP